MSRHADQCLSLSLEKIDDKKLLYHGIVLILIKFIKLLSVTFCDVLQGMCRQQGNGTKSRCATVLTNAYHSLSLEKNDDKNCYVMQMF